MVRQNWNAEVFVLGPDGSKLGKMQFGEAQKVARDKYSLDLVQINKDNDMPVYKIMDHGEYKYTKRKNQKKPVVRHLKEMSFRVCIDSHDMQTKINHIQKFLSRGDEVKISVTMRGREKSRPELGNEKLNDILSELGYTGDSDAGDTIHVQPVKSSPSSVTTTVRPLGSKNHAAVKSVSRESTPRDSSPV